MQHLCLPHKSALLLTCSVLQILMITLLIEHLLTLILLDALTVKARSLQGENLIFVVTKYLLKPLGCQF